MALTRHIWAGFNKNWQKHKHLSIVFILSHAMTQCHHTAHEWRQKKTEKKVATKESNCYTFFFSSSSKLLFLFLFFILILSLPFFRSTVVQSNSERKKPKFWWVKWCTRNVSKCQARPHSDKAQKIRRIQF